jgi:hypothetical protein
MQTALGAAFQKAGIVPATDRLSNAVASVIGMTAEEWHAALSETRDDPKQKERLLATAMEAIRANPRNWDGAKDALYKAVKDDAALLWALFEPYRLIAVQRLLTEAAAAMREQERKDMDQRLRDVKGRSDFGSREDSARSRSGMDAAAVARLSMLDTFKINGQPIGDCTAKEANAWATSRERDARFVRMLTENLPPDQPIRKFRRPEDADQFYVKANEDE